MNEQDWKILKKEKDKSYKEYLRIRTIAEIDLEIVTSLMKQRFDRIINIAIDERESRDKRIKKEIEKQEELEE